MREREERGREIEGGRERERERERSERERGMINHLNYSICSNEKINMF